MTDILLTERRGAVTVLTMNRPEAMNALSRGLRSALAAAVDAFEADGEARVLVLTGAGERAFSAGLDLKELGRDPEALTSQSPAPDPVEAIRACTKPIIGAVNGVAVTGGFELALACDILLAADTARFADTHSRVGVMPGWGLSQRLPRIIGPSRAKEMSLSARFIGAAEAADWGIVSRALPQAELMPATQTLAEEIAAAPAETIAALKAVIDDGYAMPFGDAMTMERDRARVWNRAQSPEALEARRAAVLETGRRA